MAKPNSLRLLAACAFLLYLSLSIAHALTRRPWVDEGLMAAPAMNFAMSGVLANHVWETAGADHPDGNRQAKGVDQHAYYVMPLYLLAQAVWFRLFTPSLFLMRLFSTLCGILLLAAVYFLVRVLTGSRQAALLSSALLAVDYVFLVASSFGREDMMSAALGYWALAAYMLLRRWRLPLAIAASTVLAAAAVLTHPVAAAYALGLVLLFVVFDRHRFHLRLLVYAILPAALAVLPFAIYVLQSPGDFLAQFGANAVTGDRLLALRAPWKALWLEVTKRYLAGYGLGSHSAGHSGPVFLKALILAAYVAGVSLSALVPRVRQRPGVKVLLALLGICALVLALIDSTKQFDYILHVIPFMSILFALWVTWLWEKKPVPRWILVIGVFLLVLLQTGGVAYKVKLNTYRNQYFNAVQFLRSQVDAHSYVIGSSDLAFDLGFSGKHFRDDTRLGYFSGRKADFIVLEESYQVALEGHRLHRPLVDDYIRRLLAEEYILVYDHNHYRIYRRREGAGAS